MKQMSKNLNLWLHNAYQRFRERICAPIVFKIMELMNYQRHLPFTHTGEDAQILIYNKLMEDSPCMIGRIGASEIRNIEGTLHKNGTFFQKLKWLLTLHQIKVPKSVKKYWQKTVVHNLDDQFFDDYAALTLKDIEQLDIFASWRWEETEVIPKPYHFDIISIWDLEPFFCDNPWTKALAGKKVLIIQPFTTAIENQYKKRDLLFKNKNILPEFELLTYMPFLAGVRDASPDSSWFDRLNCMKEEISKIDFDIAIIAAGTYGFSLAAHIKRMNKKALLMGGVLQLLFGIKGARWDNHPLYSKLYNEHWIRPGEKYKPKNITSYDGGCYW